MKTTMIMVEGKHWYVPRGFGRAYCEVANDPAPADVLSDILALVGYEAKEADIKAWDLRRRIEAQVYAANEHLRASDNPIQRHPRPEWLPEPWRGTDRGDGAFAGPGGTPLPPYPLGTYISHGDSVVSILVAEEGPGEWFARGDYQNLCTGAWAKTEAKAVAAVLTKLARHIRANEGSR